MLRADEGLDDRQLAHLMRDDPTFLGVFAADRLPDLETVPRPSGLIANTDPHDRPGQHWVAFRYNRPGERDEFFDSYGERPTHYRRAWTRHLRAPYKWNPRAVQSDATTVCGLYCAYFLRRRRRGQSMEALLAPFDGSKRRNDHRICRWACTHPKLFENLRARRTFCQTSVCRQNCKMVNKKT